MSKLRCSKCKHPLEIEEITVVCVGHDSTELAFSCGNAECDESFSVWVDHRNGWANSTSRPVDLRVAKGGAK